MKAAVLATLAVAALADEIIPDQAMPLCLKALERASGNLGEYVPQCADDGTYLPKQCHGSIGRCWCVDTATGEELGVELSACEPVDEAEPVVELMLCEQMKVAASGRLGSYIPQCEEDGSFSAKQCWGSTGRCWCADPTSGLELDVELSECDNTIEPFVDYVPCPEVVAATSGLIGSFVPQCEEDGSFSAKQCWASTGRCWCADTVTGEELDVELSECEPEVEIEPVVDPVSCAQKVAATTVLIGTYVPQCEEDGSYSAKQCHGSTGRCWCADTVTGEELDVELSECEPEVDIEPVVDSEISCAQKLAATSYFIGSYIPQCEEDGSYSAKQCWASTGRCWCVDTKTGEELDIELPECEPVEVMPVVEKMSCQEMLAATSGLIGAYVPQCEEDGSFSAKQCHGSTGRCWCVDTETGVKTTDDVASCTESSTVFTNKLVCAELLERVLLANATKRAHYIPQCEADGTFKPKQSFGGKFRCVDEATGKPTRADLSECPVKSAKGYTLCRDAKAAEMARGRFGIFVPTCVEPGFEFRRKQCHPLTGDCWCVESLTGMRTAEPLSSCEACSVTSAWASDPNMADAEQPRCRADGTYQDVQCSAWLRECHCVDRYSGMVVECYGDQLEQKAAIEKSMFGATVGPASSQTAQTVSTPGAASGSSGSGSGSSGSGVGMGTIPLVAGLVVLAALGAAGFVLRNVSPGSSSEPDDVGADEIPLTEAEEIPLAM